MEYNFDPLHVHNSHWNKISAKYPIRRAEDSKHIIPPCQVCGDIEKTKLCTGCYKVAYCCPKHQRQDWCKTDNPHRNQCCPYQLKVSSSGDDNKGRYMVANRDIVAGEIVLQEQPISYGPKQFTSPVCLGCCNSLSDVVCYECSGCGWPMCSENCHSTPLHMLECNILAQCVLKPDKKSPPTPSAIYECITPLRLLLAKLQGANWDVLCAMEQHTEERQKEDDEMVNINATNTVNFLLKHCKLEENGVSAENVTRKKVKVESKDIWKCIDVLDVNSFEIREHHAINNKSFRPSLRGLYPLTAMMNSICCPNTQNCIDTSTFTCTVRATRGICKGEEITTCYTSTLWGSEQRRKHLKQSKYFWCDCERCSDPTELGSHFSTLICQHCTRTHYLVKAHPLKTDSTAWKCTNCGHEMTSHQISTILDSIEEEIKNLPSTYDSHCQLIQELTVTKRKLLHPNHYLIFEIKYNAISLLSQMSNQTIDVANNRKQLVGDILTTLEILMPGLNRMTGMMLFNLFLDSWRLLKLGDVCERKNDEIVKLDTILEKCIKIFSFESKDSEEGERYAMAVEYREKLHKEFLCLQ